MSPRGRRTRWADLTPRQRKLTLLAGSVQLAMAAMAWADLGLRPAARVNGPKPLWAAVIAVNGVGPPAYLLWGRRRR